MNFTSHCSLVSLSGILSPRPVTVQVQPLKILGRPKAEQDAELDRLIGEENTQLSQPAKPMSSLDQETMTALNWLESQDHFNLEKIGRADFCVRVNGQRFIGTDLRDAVMAAYEILYLAPIVR
jgi:hypothetical protein